MCGGSNRRARRYGVARPVAKAHAGAVVSRGCVVVADRSRAQHARWPPQSRHHMMLLTADGLEELLSKDARTLFELEFQTALPQRGDEAFDMALSKPLSLMLGTDGSNSFRSAGESLSAANRCRQSLTRLRSDQGTCLLPPAGNMEIGSVPRGRPRFVIRSGLSKRWKR